MREFNESNFDSEVIGSDTPVLVCFSAVWCGPCKAISPILDQVSEEIGEKGCIGKVDVDDCPILVSQYEVKSVPTFLLFKNGEMVGKFSRPPTKQNIIQYIING